MERKESSNERTLEPRVRTNPKVVKENRELGGHPPDQHGQTSRNKAVRKTRPKQIRPKEKPVDDHQVERPGVLTQKQIEAIQHLRRAGLSYDEISKLTGISKATISKYCHGIEPDSQSTGSQEASRPVQEPARPATLVDPSLTQWNPRAKVESDFESFPSAQMSIDETSRKQGLINGDWELVKLLLLADALRSGYTDPVAYIRKAVLPDFKFVKEVKEWFPGTTNDEKRRAFMLMSRHALGYLRLRREVLSTEEALPTQDKNPNIAQDSS